MPIPAGPNESTDIAPKWDEWNEEEGRGRGRFCGQKAPKPKEQPPTTICPSGHDIVVEAMQYTAHSSAEAAKFTNDEGRRGKQWMEGERAKGRCHTGTGASANEADSDEDDSGRRRGMPNGDEQ
jgi:hypothetical protein